MSRFGGGELWLDGKRALTQFPRQQNSKRENNSFSTKYCN
jgi:hypothetical protein